MLPNTVKPEIKTKSPIFICGCERSGTTVLRNVLGKHPEIYEIKTETHFFTSQQNLLSRTLNEYEKKSNREGLITSVLEIMFYGYVGAEMMLRVKRTPLEIMNMVDEIKTLDDFKNIRTKYGAFNLCGNFLALKENKKRWVEKTPKNINRVKFILDLYPDAKIIEIYRDPRAVSCSLKNSQTAIYGSYDLIQGIKSWKDSMTKAEGYLLEIPDKFHRIRYEHLIENPEEELRKLCKFIREDFSTELLNAQTVHSFFGDMDENTGFNIIPVDRWRRSLSFNEIFLIDLSTKKLRKKLNYPDSNVKSKVFNPFSYIAFFIKHYIKNKYILNYLYMKSRSKITQAFNLITRCQNYVR